MSRVLPRLLAAALLLVALPLAALLSAARPSPAADDEATRFLRSRYDKGSYRDAIDAAEGVLEETPRDFAALDILTLAHEALGERDVAERRLRALSELPGGPTPTAARFRLGELLLARGAVAEARPLLEGGRDLPETRRRAQVALAEAALLEGGREAAATELRALFAEYVRADDASLDAGALETLARGALLAERVPSLRAEHPRPFAKDARDLLQRAFRKDGARADLLALWAQVYLEKWDLVEARRLAKAALERNGDHPLAHALLAAIALEDAVSWEVKSTIARSEIQKALATDPRQPLAHALSAELLVADGRLDEALAATEKALAGAPAHAKALGVRLGILWLERRTKDADALEKEVLTRGPIHVASAFTELSRLLDGRFQYRRAFEAASRAVAADPDSAAALRQQGFAAMRTGDEDLARARLQEAHDRDPFDLFAFNQLTLLDYVRKEFRTFRSERFILRLHREEVAALRPYVEDLLERTWADLSVRYGVALDSPLLVEVFPQLPDFSVRAVGHRFIPASGVTFDRVVVLASPQAFPPGAHGWGRVLRHELAHVATLERSGYRTPRWLTEGISVLEETKGHPGWTEEGHADIVDGLFRGRLLPLAQLNEGFSRPRFPNQVMLSYQQGGLLCQHLEELYGHKALLALLDGFREGLSLAESVARATGGLSLETVDDRFFEVLRRRYAGTKWRPPCQLDQELLERRRAAKARPQDVAAQAEYALALADMGRIPEAEVQAVALAKLEPLSGDAALVRALAAAARGQAEKGAQLAAEALALGTKDPIRANQILVGFYGAPAPGGDAPRDARKALAALEEQRRLFPENAAYARDVIQLLKASKREDLVDALLDVAADLEPNAVDLRSEIMERARKAGDLERLGKRADELIWLYPLSGVAQVALVEAWAKSRPREAERELAILRRILPGYADMARLEALVKEGGGNPQATLGESPFRPAPTLGLAPPGAPAAPTGTASPLGPAPASGPATPSPATGTAAPRPGPRPDVPPEAAPPGTPARAPGAPASPSGSAPAPPTPTGDRLPPPVFSPKDRP